MKTALRVAKATSGDFLSGTFGKSALWLTVAIVGAIFVAGNARNVRAEEPQAETSDEGHKTLKVISYNVQFLPGIAAVANKRREPAYRAEQLAEKMARYDVVGLNETFDPRYRKIILDGLQKAWGEDYHVVVSPKVEDKPFNGGLLIASRLPFVDTHTMVYTQSSSPEKYGLKADGFAAKGVLHARIAPSEDAKDDYFDVFVTHMEARDDEVRETQYEEIGAFVLKHSDPQHTALMLGDFNTRGNLEYQRDKDSAYHRLLKALSAGRPRSEIQDLWIQLKGEANGGTTEQESSEIGRRIDYVFVSPPEGKAHRLKPVDIRVNGFLDERVGALSDHSAVEADFQWPLTPGP